MAHLTPRRRSDLTALAIAAIGTFVVVLNHPLPILRNSFLYARIALKLGDTDLLRIVADGDVGYGNPIGFALLARPFVSLFGANLGMQVASWVGGLALIAACLGFLRRLNPLFGLDESHVPLELVLIFANPLVLYQFWSAYPDGLFTALAIAGFAILDLAVRERDSSPLWLVASYLCFYLAITVRHYGGVFLLLHAVVLLGNWRALRDNVLARRGHLAALLGSWLVVGVMVGLALTGRNPTLSISLDSGGAWHYLSGAARVVGLDVDWVPEDGLQVERRGDSRLSDAQKRDRGLNLKQFAGWLFLGFGPSALLALSRTNLRWRYLPYVLVPGGYVVGLMSYPHTWFNMRYFLPVGPFLALFVASGLGQPGRRVLRRAVLAVALVVACLLALNYNTALGQRLFAPLNRHLLPRVSRPDAWWKVNIDSLRMERHLTRKAELDHINETLPEGAILFLIHRYKGGVLQGLYQASGLIRADIEVRDYEAFRLVPRSERDVCRDPAVACYTYQLSRSRQMRPEVGMAEPREMYLEDMAWGLWRIDPRWMP